MALDFPASPTNGQVYGSWTYNSTKGVWQASPIESAVATASATAPLSPAAGDTWFNTNDGTFFVYYSDGTSSQWVESRAPITANGYFSANYILNSGFDIWQRGTSFSVSSSTNVYTADRWKCSVDGTTTVSQQTTGAPPGNRYVLRVARATATAGGGGIYQMMETLDALELVGETVTASILIRRDSTMTGTASFTLLKSSTVDATDAATWVTVGTNNIATASMPTGTTSADWYRATITATIPNDGTANSLRFGITASNMPNGSYYEVAEAQLEIGAVATVYRRAYPTMAGELAACQRFYYRIGPAIYSPIGVGLTLSTTQSAIAIQFPVTMRAAPGTPEYSGIIISDRSSSDAAVSGFGTTNSAVNGMSIYVNHATGFVQYRPVIMSVSSTAGGYIGFSAEL